MRHFLNHAQPFLSKLRLSKLPLCKCHLCCQRRVLKEVSKSRITATVLIWGVTVSVVLSGCDANKTDAQDSSVDPSYVNETSLNVGTDLDIVSLQAASAVFTQETGIKVNWVPIDTDFNHYFANKALLVDPIETPIKVDDMDSQIPATLNNPFDDHFNNSLEETPQRVKEDIERLNTPQTVAEQKDSVVLPQQLDMLLMHSAYTMAEFGEARLLQPLGSQILMEVVPIQYQDPKGTWFGLSQYGRTLVYNKNNVNRPELLNYAVLAADKWQGRVCMTDITKPENQAIAKIMWTYRGRTNTPKILAGWDKNMGEPIDNDHQVLANIATGVCDVGIVDSDVFWQYAKTHPYTPIRLTWANQINRGTMTNVITAGVTKTAQQAGRALAFIEWLTGQEGQALLAFNTNTFPIIEMTEPTINNKSIRPSWTQFDADTTPLIKIMEKEAVIPLPMSEVDVANVTSREDKKKSFDLIEDTY